MHQELKLHAVLVSSDQADLKDQSQSTAEEQDFWKSFLQQGFPLAAHIWKQSRKLPSNKRIWLKEITEIIGKDRQI